jgi:hypothetical protein
VGARFEATFWGGRGAILIERGGTVLADFDSSRGFMPPPEGTEEIPGIWY